MLRGSTWESSFEADFGIDNEVHSIIAGIRKLKPFGYSVSDIFPIIKLLFKKDRTLKDTCNFFHLEEKLHRNLLLLLQSLLIRSPSARSRYSSYPEMIGLPHDEDVGKANMAHNYRIARDRCQKGTISNQFFVFLYSPLEKFNFGDGSLDWLTYNLAANRISGRALVPLTPDICVYFFTPPAMLATPNCASLIAAPWMIDSVNKVTQIYSKEMLFFKGAPPKIIDAFRQNNFLEHKKKSDSLIDTLEGIVCCPRRSRPSWSLNGL